VLEAAVVVCGTEAVDPGTGLSTHHFDGGRAHISAGWTQVQEVPTVKYGGGASSSYQ